MHIPLLTIPPNQPHTLINLNSLYSFSLLLSNDAIAFFNSKPELKTKKPFSPFSEPFPFPNSINRTLIGFPQFRSVVDFNYG
ncbi:unnamed protein product [Lathyrus oleraceus]